MDSEALVKILADQIKEGQEAVRGDVAAVRKDVGDVKASVARLDERLDHVRDNQRASEEIELRVRRLEQGDSHRRGRDAATAFGLGALGASLTLFWDDILGFFRGI